MKAYLEPLSGKYYGSEITVTDDEGTEGLMVVWLMQGYEPSERELETLPSDVDQSDYFCDSHYETQFCYEVCKRIVEALNDEGQTSSR